MTISSVTFFGGGGGGGGVYFLRGSEQNFNAMVVEAALRENRP